MANNCDEPMYVKLVEALCAEHGIHLLKVSLQILCFNVILYTSPMATQDVKIVLIAQMSNWYLECWLIPSH